MHTNSLSERGCDACLESKLSSRISHPAQTQKIDISYSTAVIRYVQRLYMTCAFQVMSVCMYTQMLYQKQEVMCV